jgi:single-strand DNA-binding protein
VNKIILVGNLTRDPELSTVPSGVSVCKFSIAVNRRQSKDGTRETDFFNIVVWRTIGENCAKYLKKGNRVGVVGEMHFRNYEQDGVKKTYSEVVADEVEFLTPKGGDAGGEMTPISDDSLPF